MAKRKTKQTQEHITINVEQVDFHTEYKNAYTGYGFSVIKERALPDVRDGLKPVHRAIAFEMLISKAKSTDKFKKVAKLSGAVIGNWHPHGDKAVEDALAGMAAPWKNSMPSIEIKGNGGSVFGDPHAAGRYIEARLSPTGDAYGKKLKKGIVPYVQNFDETAMMPDILPAHLPYLLINGGEGIAVGVASSIPTHNPIEVVEAFISYMKNPKQTVAELMTIIQGPDFPTHAEVINKSELPQIYETGLGKIRVRGRLRYNEKTNSLHVYEIPYTAAGSMGNLVEEITTASMETVDKKGKKVPPKVDGISSVKDHSGKRGIDITIILKRGVDPEAIKAQLFAKTRLETTLKFDMTALNNRQLKRYSLKQYFKEYLAFQHEITTNEYIIEKEELENRMEIIKGLLIMNKYIDEVIESAKKSNGKAELIESLMTGKVINGVDKVYHNRIKEFSFSEIQATHIANIPLYRINKMDFSALVDEGREIMKKINYAKGIVEDVTKRKRLIMSRHKEELKNLDPEQFARKTDIIDAEIAKVSKLEIPESPLYVSMDKYQYVRISEKKLDDSIETTNKSRIGFIAENGICWNLHLESTQLTPQTGTIATQLVKPNSPIIGWTNLINSENERFGLFIYANGNAKITDMRKYVTKSKSTKVSSGKSDIPLLKYEDIPEDTVAIKVNDIVTPLSDFSVNGISGKGKHMYNNIDETSVIEFITDPNMIPKTRKKSSNGTKTDNKNAQKPKGIIVFTGDDTASFNWETDIPDETSMFSIDYETLLKTDVLFIHTDGTAKIVHGDQFKVSTKRKSIQADKKGSESLYIGAVPKTVIGNYTDGTKKRIETSLISNQGKAGGGVRALYTTKHQLESITIDESSDLECVSLATQPK